MKKMTEGSDLSPQQISDFLVLLKDRFENNLHRHKGVQWADVEKKLIGQPEKISALHQMELTGGEPDLVQYEKKTKHFIFFDCAKETPTKRRSLCYDQQALEERKEHKPKDNAMDMAGTMGIQLMTEEQYRYLQELEPVDLKTSSWIQTPASIRKLGGALFCDRRYNQVFTYHNGASSYYAARGFRGVLIV